MGLLKKYRRTPAQHREVADYCRDTVHVIADVPENKMNSNLPSWRAKMAEAYLLVADHEIALARYIEIGGVPNSKWILASVVMKEQEE